MRGEERLQPAWLDSAVVVHDDGRPRQAVPGLFYEADRARHQHEVSPAHLHRDLQYKIQVSLFILLHSHLFKYLLDLLAPATEHVTFKRNCVVIFGYPVVESSLHPRVGRVHVGQEALQTVPPLQVVDEGLFLRIRALEGGLGAADVVHHELAGAHVSLVVSGKSASLSRDVAPVYHHHGKRLPGAAPAAISSPRTAASLSRVTSAGKKALVS